jgi:CTP synthase (UTP-ammonia lyase)
VNDAVRIGILGDFNPKSPNLPAVAESLQHAAAKLGLPLEAVWLPTPALIAPDAERLLENFDGLWAAPGSPYKSMDGMLKGIEFARRRDWPFLATCGGFQYALIEFARNVLGIADADSAENKSASKNIVIYPVACAVPNPKLFTATTNSTLNTNGVPWKRDSPSWLAAPRARFGRLNLRPTNSSSLRFSSLSSHPSRVTHIPW